MLRPLLLVVVLLAASAPAQTRAVKDGAPSNQLQIDLGLASAVGEIGLTYARLFGAHVELEAGYTGPQLSLMPRLALGLEKSRFVCGLGLSVSLMDREPRPEKSIVPWLNVDLVGYEHRSANGFVFAVSAGTSTSLADGRFKAIWNDYSFFHLGVGLTFPQVRLGLGAAF